MSSESTMVHTIVYAWAALHVFALVFVGVLICCRRWIYPELRGRSDALWIGPINMGNGLPAEMDAERMIQGEFRCTPLWVTVWEAKEARVSLRNSGVVDEAENYVGDEPFIVASFNSHSDARQAARRINMGIGKDQGGELFGRECKAVLLNPSWRSLRNRFTFVRESVDSSNELTRMRSETQSEDETTDEDTDSTVEHGERQSAVTFGSHKFLLGSSIIL